MRERFVQVACVFWLAVSAPAFADGLTGTYVAKAPTGAVLIQIVETSGGKLTGRYEHVVLLPTGDLDRMNASVTGASDGQAIVITIVPVDLSGDIVASGSFDGSILHLTGGGTGAAADLNLARSNEADFQLQADALADQARRVRDAAMQAQQSQRLATTQAEEAIRIAAAQASRLVAIDDLIKKMAAFTESADAHLAKFASIGQRYRSGTAAMKVALAHERSTFGNGQTAFSRGQIAFDIRQARFGADQLHASVQSEYQDFQTASEPLLSLLSDADGSCQSSGAVANASSGATTSDPEASSCLRLAAGGRRFRSRVDAVQKAFAKIESVWLEVRPELESIVQASENRSD